MYTFAPVVRCTYQSCGGWIQRNSWDGGLECGLCTRRVRLDGGGVVLLEPVLATPATMRDLARHEHNSRLLDNAVRKRAVVK